LGSSPGNALRRLPETRWVYRDRDSPEGRGVGAGAARRGLRISPSDGLAAMLVSWLAFDEEATRRARHRLGRGERLTTADPLDT